MAKDRIWVIVEGPDGAGKSTIAKQVAHILASEGRGRPERPVMLQKLSYDSPYNDYQLPGYYGQLHAVQDRGPMSGLVYEPLMRGDEERMSWFDPLSENVISMGAATLYVTASEGVLRERLEKRGDDYVGTEKLPDILEAYERESGRWKGKGGGMLTFDTTWEFPSETELALSLSRIRSWRR